MNKLTERQKNILEIVIREYIANALPISSKYIEEEYDLGISPATIRAELFNLTEQEYLYQPHTSAGRIPTDKGYRFFVDLLASKEIKKIKERTAVKVRKMRQEVESKASSMIELIQFLAHNSSSLTVSYFPRENILLKEGWGEVLRDPEFEDIEKVHEFMEMVEDFEKNIDSFLLPENEKCIHVYIGNETPFLKRSNFSILISPCTIFKKKGLLAIMGPKRMSYERNISLVDSIIKLLRE